uniref:F-box domain-containing protein n=1 Tax=Ditylum brightwellii TaxID=49249 RepID=A0A6U3Z8Z8_9STRA|mmetsp:Transcript_7898/g.11767  ORF Transcript_7898/g.11767 Transcript_7898/m.11767 type:complete len:263 (+) Transcript_7898:76-864(+)
MDEPNSFFTRLPDELITSVLRYAGPEGTALIGATCKQLNELDNSSNTLWFNFVKDRLRLGQAGGEDTSWRDVYVCCAQVIKPESSQAKTTHLINLRHVYNSDHQSYYSTWGYGADNVFNRDRSCWSTSPGVNQNVNLLANIAPKDDMAIVTGFEITTPKIYTADCPPKTVLAFASTKEITATGMYTCLRHSSAEPISQINVPPPPCCHDQTLFEEVQPIIGRTFLFKIIESYNPRGHEGGNIDVQQINLHGYVVPGLAALLN